MSKSGQQARNRHRKAICGKFLSRPLTRSIPRNPFIRFQKYSELSPSQTNVFKIDQPSFGGLEHHVSVMAKKLSPKAVLAIPCPTCGAAPGEMCELSTGQPRTNPHRDRK